MPPLGDVTNGRPLASPTSVKKKQKMLEPLAWSPSSAGSRLPASPSTLLMSPPQGLFVSPPPVHLQHSGLTPAMAGLSLVGLPFSPAAESPAPRPLQSAMAAMTAPVLSSRARRSVTAAAGVVGFTMLVLCTFSGSTTAPSAAPTEFAAAGFALPRAKFVAMLSAASKCPNPMRTSQCSMQEAPVPPSVSMHKLGDAVRTALLEAEARAAAATRAASYTISLVEELTDPAGVARAKSARSGASPADGAPAVEAPPSSAMEDASEAVFAPLATELAAASPLVTEVTPAAITATDTDATDTDATDTDATGAGMGAETVAIESSTDETTASAIPPSTSPMATATPATSEEPTPSPHAMQFPSEPRSVGQGGGRGLATVEVARSAGLMARRSMAQRRRGHLQARACTAPLPQAEPAHPRRLPQHPVCPFKCPLTVPPSVNHTIHQRAAVRLACSQLALEHSPEPSSPSNLTMTPPAWMMGLALPSTLSRGIDSVGAHPLALQVAQPVALTIPTHQDERLYFPSLPAQSQPTCLANKSASSSGPARAPVLALASPLRSLASLASTDTGRTQASTEALGASSTEAMGLLVWVPPSPLAGPMSVARVDVLLAHRARTSRVETKMLALVPLPGNQPSAAVGSEKDDGSWERTMGLDDDADTCPAPTPASRALVAAGSNRAHALPGGEAISTLVRAEIRFQVPSVRSPSVLAIDTSDDKSDAISRHGMALTLYSPIYPASLISARPSKPEQHAEPVAATQTRVRYEHPEALPPAEWWLQGQDYVIAMVHQISEQTTAFAAAVAAGADQLLSQSSGAAPDWTRLLGVKWDRPALSDYDVSPPRSMLWASTLLAFFALLVTTTTSSRGCQEPSGSGGAVTSKMPAAAPAKNAAQLIRQMANEPMTPANPMAPPESTETAETAPPPPSATPSEDGRALLESAVTDGLEGLQPLVLFDLKPR